MDAKKWYLSKTIWGGVITIIVLLWNAIPQQFPDVHLPAIPDYLIGILAALGIYGRVNATTTIEK